MLPSACIMGCQMLHVLLKLDCCLGAPVPLDKSWPLPAMGDNWFCSILLSCGATPCLDWRTSFALWQYLGSRCSMLDVLMEGEGSQVPSTACLKHGVLSALC